MIPKEKQATVLQAFPFQACFNEQIFLRSRKKSSVRAYLRVCRRPKRKASDTTLDTKEEDVYEKNAVWKKHNPKIKHRQSASRWRGMLAFFLCISYWYQQHRDQQQQVIIRKRKRKDSSKAVWVGKMVWRHLIYRIILYWQSWIVVIISWQNWIWQTIQSFRNYIVTEIKFQQ